MELKDNSELTFLLALRDFRALIGRGRLSIFTINHEKVTVLASAQLTLLLTCADGLSAFSTTDRTQVLANGLIHEAPPS